MFSIKKALTILTLSLPTMVFGAEYTSQAVIGSLEFDGQTNKFYISNKEGTGFNWGVASCPKAQYVLLDTTLPGSEKIFSLAVAAKMSKNPVRFYGVCDPTNEFTFITTYIHVI